MNALNEAHKEHLKIAHKTIKDPRKSTNLTSSKVFPFFTVNGQIKFCTEDKLISTCNDSHPQKKAAHSIVKSQTFHCKQSFFTLQLPNTMLSHVNMRT